MSGTINLTADGGVRKRILRSAKADAVSPSDMVPVVDVHYEGRLEGSDSVFDSSREDNAVFSFEVGKGNVIRAWDLGIKTMKVGELAELICSPDYAYGEAGSPPDIPPGATLVFEVELMAVKPPRGASSEGALSQQSRLEEVRREREAAAAKREEEKRKKEEAKEKAAAKLKEKMEAKSKGNKGGKGKK